MRFGSPAPTGFIWQFPDRWPQPPISVVSREILENVLYQSKSREDSMKKLNILGFAVVAMLLSANAWAGFAQTFVSGTGINTNTSCSVGAPCASIQVALNLTNPGGQVIVEGSG